MRMKSFAQRYLTFELVSSSTKEGQQYREQYWELDRILLGCPNVLDLAHAAFSQYLSTSAGGRGAQYSSEQILRSLIVKQVEGLDYRETVIRIENSEFLRAFVGLGCMGKVMHHTFLVDAFGALSGTTWAKMNIALGLYAQETEQIGGEALRTDTTAVETNVHYPTDSSLLWDGYRVLVRELRRVRKDCPWLGLDRRFHDKKVKKRVQFIARNAKSTSKRTQRKVRTAYGALLEDVRRVLGISRLVQRLLDFRCWEFAPLLEEFDAVVDRVIEQTQRRVFEGEKLPASEKIYSIFESHTELIQRGKAGKPIEFGHKVVFTQTREKFISHWRVLETEEDDNTLVDEILDTHERLFGHVPDVFAADKGFYQSMEQISELEERIPVVSMCKKGARTLEEEARENSKAFRDGQKFRAGIEGSISVLKRAFNLKRCLFKGFKHFVAGIGSAVFCHNLMVLARG